MRLWGQTINWLPLTPLHISRAQDNGELEGTLYLQPNPRTDRSYFAGISPSSGKDAQTDSLLAARNLGNQILHNAWVCERTQVTKLISLAGREFPHNTAHDLA